ncbi:MAG TPA: AI-2E family transporter [Opitutaceae bacterium]|nr:AI-2E family transporter [Opitutaceae bacterium]
MADSAPLLSPAQRKVVAFAMAFAAATVIVLLLGLLVFGLGRALAFFSGVIWPLAAAGIVALILRPVVDLLERRLRIGRIAAVILLYGLFVALVCGCALAIAPAVVSQAAEFAAAVPKLWLQASEYAEKHYPEWIAYGRDHLQNPAVKQLVDGVAAQVQELFAGMMPGVKSAVSGLRGAVSFVLGLALVPVYLFFFLRSTGDMFVQVRGMLSFLREDLRDDLVFLAREFVAIVVAFFRGQLLIGLIMGALYALGFTIAGLRFGLVIGLAMGLLNIVPYLGTMLGLAIALPLAFLGDGGGMWLVGAVLAVFSAVQVIEGWVLTPRIMGHQTGLHPVAVIVAIVFWGTALNGVLGMVLAIPLTAFFVTAWRLAKFKYLPQPQAAAKGP